MPEHDSLVISGLSKMYAYWGFTVAVLFGAYLVITLRTPTVQSIPLIGARKGDWFPYIQALLRNTRDFQTALQNAFEHGRPVTAPVAGEGELVILPSEEVKFIVEQPSSVLGFDEGLIYANQTDHTFLDPAIPRMALGETLIRQNITPQIGSFMKDMVEEVEWVLKQHWEGSESIDGWHEVCVFETMRNTVGNVANRAFVGLPLCRNKELADNSIGFATDVPMSSSVLKSLWKPLRRLVAPFLTIANRNHTRRFRKIMAPEIKRRMHDYDIRQQELRDGKTASELQPEPNDLLQWSVQQAKASGEPYLLRPETVADRLLLFNFGAIHTTTMMGTEFLLDLLSSKKEYVDEIRTEVETVLADHGGVWDKVALGKLVKLDSAIRESARYSCFLTTGLQRMVVAKDGVMTPSGVHLPHGVRVVVPVYNIMRDEKVYAEADTFKPFRFVDEGENTGARNDRLVGKALYTTTPEFLIFGHGKYACPGRFFASSELKLILATAFVKYDFEMLPEKPDSPWYGAIKFPPMKATIRFKPRKES